MCSVEDPAPPTDLEMSTVSKTNEDSWNVFATDSTDLLPSPPTSPKESLVDPWFRKCTEDRHDREEMPCALVVQLLRDESFQPGGRPSSVLSATGPMTMEQIISTCLPREGRVFKEYCPVPRRANAVDFWHNAGGNRSKKAIPSPDNPILWRWYGAIEQQIAGDAGPMRVATYNYHAYKLVEHVDAKPQVNEDGQARIPVLYHIFTSRTLFRLACPKKAPERAQKCSNAADAGAQLTPRSGANATGSSVQVNFVNAALPHARQQNLWSTFPLTNPGRSTGSSSATGAAVMVLDTPAAEETAKVMSFERGGTVVGEFALNRTTGIVLQSTGGDVAEWHELEDGEAGLLEGDIVAIVK